jgi:hypothetical protein
VIGFDIDAASDLKRATLDLTSDKAVRDWADFSSTPYRPRSMLPIGPIWVQCSRPRAVPVAQEIAVGEK